MGTTAAPSGAGKKNNHRETTPTKAGRIHIQSPSQFTTERIKLNNRYGGQLLYRTELMTDGLHVNAWWNYQTLGVERVVIIDNVVVVSEDLAFDLIINQCATVLNNFQLVKPQQGMRLVKTA